MHSRTIPVPTPSTTRRPAPTSRAFGVSPRTSRCRTRMARAVPRVATRLLRSRDPHRSDLVRRTARGGIGKGVLNVAHLHGLREHRHAQLEARENADPAGKVAVAREDEGKTERADGRLDDPEDEHDNARNVAHFAVDLVSSEDPDDREADGDGSNDEDQYTSPIRGNVVLECGDCGREGGRVVSVRARIETQGLPGGSRFDW